MKTFSKNILGGAISALCLTPIGGAVMAEPLSIAIGGAFTTMDPHFYNATPNHTVAMQVFDRLIDRNPDTSLSPALAVSWEAVSDTVWEFKLREGVAWHDGEPFTADDVAFTYERAPEVPNSPGGFGGFLREVGSVEVVDPLTLRITTRQPAPNLPRNLAFVPIISEHVGKTATTEDYNSGKAVIGTGPFKFASYTPGDRVEYTRNDDWWGGEVDWETLTLRSISDPGARVAALLSGDVDIIDTPPAGDLERLSSQDGIQIFSTPGMRVMYLIPNFRDEVKKHVSAKDGSTLDANPLADVKVREALSLALNREAIADRIMEGAAVPTGQWLAEGSFSYNENVSVPVYDPEKAKTLLTEAGYPDGFKLDIVGPNNRYPNDGPTTQAAAQFWTRIGIDTKVATLPWSAYSSASSDGSFAVSLMGWGSPTGEAGYLLSNVIASSNPDEGLGIYNRGGYSNPELDTLIVDALATIDDSAREQKLKEAVQIVGDDLPIIPLFMLNNNWAVRAGIDFEARRDERTLATDARLAD